MRPDEIPDAVVAAHRLIGPLVLETPLRHSPHFSRVTGADVYLKLESLQVTGSFKARGASYKVARLSPEDRSKGVVTASSGNHGAGSAYALARTGTKGIVFVPNVTPRVKIDAIEAYGAEVRFHSGDGGEAEIFARAFAAEHRLTYISPYNDPDIIAGQGTAGLEIDRQLGDRPLDILAVAVGGGGLISGVAGYLKARRPGLRVLGISPVNDHALALSVKAGRIVEHTDAQPTLSDGTAGGIEPGSITLALATALVDDWVLVTEDEIRDAMRDFIARESMLLEGAAGAAIAGVIKRAQESPASYRGKTVAILVCGARIDLKKLASVVG